MSEITLPKTEIEIPFTWRRVYKNQWVDPQGFKSITMTYVIVFSAFIGLIAGVAVELTVLGQPQGALMDTLWGLVGAVLFCIPSSLTAKYLTDKKVDQWELDKRKYNLDLVDTIIAGLIGSQLFDNTHVTVQAALDLVENKFALLETRYGETYELHLQRELVTLYLSAKDIKENTINHDAKEWAEAHPKADIAEAYAAGRRSV